MIDTYCARKKGITQFQRLSSHDQLASNEEMNVSHVLSNFNDLGRKKFERILWKSRRGSFYGIHSFRV
jgi:hypothetical protein